MPNYSAQVFSPDTVAEVLARGVHVDQTDLNGDPYLDHVSRVVDGVDTPIQKTVAWLHDVIEDSSIELEFVRGVFGDVVGDAVEAITHDPENPYDEYYEKVAQNGLATVVKISDLEDNLDISRLDEMTEEDWNRTVKYGHAHRKLLEVANE